MIARRIRPEEWLRTEELFALAFEIPMERKPDAKPDEALHWAAFDTDGEMMSTLMSTDFTVHFDGSACRMGGIGGVATLPQYRRRGGIRGCFEAMLPELAELGYDFSYLYPFSTRFYRQFGYENCVTKQQVTVDLSLLKLAPPAGTFRLCEPRNDLRREIAAVDALWEHKYNMAVRHNEKFYDWVNKLDPAVKQEFCYVYFRTDGTPGAYVCCRKEDQPDGRNLQCSRFVFADREGYEALLWLFQTMAADHHYVRFPLPDDPGMRYLMPEWSLGAASWSIAPAGMVRVVRVKAVLEKARYIGSGAITLKIDDPNIPENNGTFAVIFAEGKAMLVTPSNVAPDVTLTIPTFSALITGATPVTPWLPGITVHNPNAPIHQVFYKKDLYISDYF